MPANSFGAPSSIAFWKPSQISSFAPGTRSTSPTIFSNDPRWSNARMYNRPSYPSSFSPMLLISVLPSGEVPKLRQFVARLDPADRAGARAHDDGVGDRPVGDITNAA